MVLPTVGEPWACSVMPSRWFWVLSAWQLRWIITGIQPSDSVCLVFKRSKAPLPALGGKVQKTWMGRLKPKLLAHSSLERKTTRTHNRIFILVMTTNCTSTFCLGMSNTFSTLFNPQNHTWEMVMSHGRDGTKTVPRWRNCYKGGLQWAAYSSSEWLTNPVIQLRTPCEDESVPNTWVLTKYFHIHYLLISAQFGNEDVFFPPIDKKWVRKRIHDSVRVCPVRIDWNKTPVQLWKHLNQEEASQGVKGKEAVTWTMIPCTPTTLHTEVTLS